MRISQFTIGNPQYGKTGYGVFKSGDTKLEIFLPKNQHIQRRSLKVENGVVGMCQKVPKFDIQSQFSMQKSSVSFQFIFHLRIRI